jgi:hypothetical protein
VKPRFIAPLDPGFSPLVLARREYRQEVEASGGVADCALVIERHDNLRSRFDFQVLELNDQNIGKTYQYVERMLKFLLWSRGGWKVYFAGPAEIGRRIGEDYCSAGRRAFDVELMSTAYRRPFEVEVVELAEVPGSSEAPLRIGGEPDGCRIGTIMEARQIVLLAFGNRKAAAVQQVVEGSISAMWPATVLQMHPSVVVLLDEAAAASLDQKDYYREVADNKPDWQKI